jgi:PLP dependent protein
MTSAATRISDSPLVAVRDEIARACVDARRDPATVTLVAISKMFGTDAITPVIAAGQRGQGEMAGADRVSPWHRTPSGRAVAVEQGEGRGGAVRRDPFR